MDNFQNAACAAFSLEILLAAIRKTWIGPW